MSKKKFISPLQLTLLTGGSNIGFFPSADDGVDAKPNPFVDEEEEIILPDGGSVTTNGEDVIIAPDSTSDFSSETDEAYY